MNASNISQLRPKSRRSSRNRSRNPSVTSEHVCVNADCVNKTRKTSVGRQSRKASVYSNQSRELWQDGAGPKLLHLSPDIQVQFMDGRSDHSKSDEEIEGCRFSDIENIGPSYLGGPEEEAIKRKLKFFFMNPIEKYRATKKLPWKLLLQVLKVVIVTSQLWIFATFRYSHANYFADQSITFKNFFLKDWDTAREINRYPPSKGKLALYRRSQFFKFVDFSVETFRNIETDSITPFFRNSSFGLCVEHLRTGRVFRDLSYDIDAELDTDCLYIAQEDLKQFNGSKAWLEEKNLTVPWTAVELLYLDMSLTSVTLHPLGPLEGPTCFRFNIRINFDRRRHSGQVPIDLAVTSERLDCPGGEGVQEKTNYTQLVVVILNLSAICICSASLFLCIRALLRAQLLKQEAANFLDSHFGWTFTASEKLTFLNLWYVMICVNDSLIITASVLTQFIEVHFISGNMWDLSSLLLGTGDMLVWFGLLRYLGFFQTYNVLILTLKGAIPNVLRFLLCASFIYFGFVFAGWVILGPYHFKFKTIMSTLECLFSLVNGDDIFATFNSIPQDRPLCIRVYCRVYLFLFISVFTYVILSLFIAIIMDTYEIIKENYNSGYPQSRLEQFYMSSEFDFSSGTYAADSMSSRVKNLIRSRCVTARHGYEEIS